MTISNLFSTGRSEGDSRAGITVNASGRGYYNPTRSICSIASSVSLPSVPGNIALTGAVGGRELSARVMHEGRPHFPQEASVQAQLTVKRDHRKCSFLFLSTD